MVRLVHEQSEAEIHARRVGEALAELTAQLLRLSAGAGSVSRLVAALRSLDETMEEAGGSVVLHQAGLHDALRFDRRDLSDFTLDIHRETESIIRHALRVTASRLEGNTVQESRSEHELHRAISEIERLREASRKRFHEERRAGRADAEASVRALLANSLTPAMANALAFLAVTDREARKALPRPQTRTLLALQDRKMIAPGDGPLGYVLTPAGRRARAGRKNRRK